MRKVAILGPGLNALFPHIYHAEVVQIEGQTLSCGLVNAPKPNYTALMDKEPEGVLIQVKGFSCNYRDKAGIFRMVASGPPFTYYVIGSEFVGTVAEVGQNVQNLCPGDRVIGNCTYPWLEDTRVPGGIPTISASAEWLLLKQSQVIKIPDNMPDADAAAFSLGAQTSYSILRKLNIQSGQNILITAARSNTALFLLNALRTQNVNVYLTTSSTTGHEQMKKLGAREIIQIRHDAASSLNSLKELATQLGGFDAIIDPFVDVHFKQLIGLLDFNGRYITCGMLNMASLPHNAWAEEAWHQALSTLIIKNISLIGNCLGTTADIKNAIQDYQAGRFQVMLDSVFPETTPGAFIKRTFASSDRLGKVVCLYH